MILLVKNAIKLSALNVKILHPLEVINHAIKAYRKQPETISLSQVEGFVRQVLGWREYIRGLYWKEMPTYKGLNALENTNPLPDFYWTGETKMNCLSTTVKNSLEHAYAHHIQRLMITGRDTRTDIIRTGVMTQLFILNCQ